MIDRETGSVWHHFNGASLSGHYEGTTLDFLPVQMMRWEQWVGLYPGTSVLSDQTGYEQEYREIVPGSFTGYTSSFTDTRLPANAIVLGVQVDGVAKAYPQQLVDELGGVANDGIGDEPVVVFFDVSGSGLAYSPTVNGQLLEFVPHQTTAGYWKDTLTGTVWNSLGRAILGELAGTQLEWHTSFVTEWYGWAEYHPATDIFGSSTDWARVEGPALNSFCC